MSNDRAKKILFEVLPPHAYIEIGDKIYIRGKERGLVCLIPDGGDSSPWYIRLMFWLRSRIAGRSPKETAND